MGRLLNNRYAAIDIGTNGVRLLMASINGNNGSLDIQKDTSIRIPIRLGEDVFSTGQISKEKEDDLINALKGFHYLIKTYKPAGYRAVATSAMREALNGEKVVRKILRKSKIKIDTISGAEEAQTIYSAHLGQNQEDNKYYLLIDVGGGSTEIIFFKGNEVIESMSFNIGTVRNLHGNENQAELDKMKKWLSGSKPKTGKTIAIGTGGNINRAFKILTRKKQNFLNYPDLKLLHGKLKSISISERMKKYKLKSDRADVIVPALNIYISIMKQLDIKKIIVPGIGLVDGLIIEMARKQDL